ncbi:drug/metabolite transporter superfamily protein [Nitzschia inconspicua]|uniref:Drug/metabolite transporter superfamily protein n=1 Tax=Nitzschia inconspicua TaxID=303405 RepID=A0A9K3Q1F4_9STRA|nr:drug/metabolite transporter superfamily protein [Nitzschia inconspicua]
MSLLEGCTETCGWFAAVLAVFAWGTFGVPIKSNVNVDVNFFVMQSYKTIVCFVTSWLVILLGEPIRFSAWGIVSGLFWVPGASCGIYAIRNAGIAVAVGTWSSIQVVVSCIFGIIIFQEKVKDKAQTMLAFFILMMGLIGMSIYADPSNGKSSSTEYLPINLTEPLDPATEKSTLTRSSSSTGKKRKSKTSPKKSTSNKVLASKQDDLSVESVTPTVVAPLEIDDTSENVLEDDGKTLSKDRVICFGGRLVLTKRQLGVLGAVVNGAWGGLNLIPLHYAQRDQGMSGAGYVISYASGSMLVCILIWIGIFLYQYVKKGYSVTDAVDSLPKWHINELGVPGVLAGLLYSIGNFCSILAVSYLGQGVGFSFCQGQLLISGLWGVFYFQEIQGRETIMKWFVSAAVAVTGIVYLSYQKGGAAVHR